MTSFRISSDVTTGTYVTFGTGARLVGPAIRTTSAPRSRAASARAQPILPDERFDRNRTGSSGSCVGPAVMRIRRPRKSLAQSAPEIAARMMSSSGKRPWPTRPDANGPTSGSSTVTPR